MAVFMINICTFDNCGLTFPRLDELIYHIEYKHINRDPLVLEQKEASQPSSVAFSYVLRFSSEATIRDYESSVASAAPTPEAPSLGSSTPSDIYYKPYPKKPGRAHLKHFNSSKYLEKDRLVIGSEFEEEDAASPSEDSNDSWTTVAEYSSDYILRYGSRMNASGLGAPGPAAADKPFACPVPGCKKRYKNINGIKYHSKNGHKKDGKVRKGYKCHCGKSYKTDQGLKNHTVALHFDKRCAGGGPSPSPAPTIQGLVVASYTPSQPLAYLHLFNALKEEPAATKHRPGQREPEVDVSAKSSHKQRPPGSRLAGRKEREPSAPYMPPDYFTAPRTLAQ